MKGIRRGLFSGLLIAVMAVAMACGGSSDGGGGGGDPLDPNRGSSSSSASRPRATFACSAATR